MMIGWPSGPAAQSSTYAVSAALMAAQFCRVSMVGCLLTALDTGQTLRWPLLRTAAAPQTAAHTPDPRQRMDLPDRSTC